jgi:hypothetical protein
MQYRAQVVAEETEVQVQAEQTENSKETEDDEPGNRMGYFGGCWKNKTLVKWDLVDGLDGEKALRYLYSGISEPPSEC